MEKLRFNAKSLAVLLAVFFLGTSAAWANIIADGTVTDSAGEPLIGVSVVEKGASNGVTTDIDGKFRINVADGATLTFSYVGYDPVEAMAAEAMSIVLKESSTMLDEVVAVGYGTQKKSVVTAAIAKVGSDELTATAPVRMDNALKGLASGVTVTSSSGQPGAAARVRIRGIGTINNSDPLYIVDGMPIEGGLDYLNPNDIASIEVLKDAASGAVYGARAANGVVLVTTKQGKEGATKVSYDFSYGWQNVAKKRKVLNAQEYAMMMNEGAVNAGLAPVFADPASYGEGTDWQEEVFNNNAPMMNHQFAVSGGTQRVTSAYLSSTKAPNAHGSTKPLSTPTSPIPVSRAKTSKPTLPGVRPSARPCRCHRCSLPSSKKEAQKRLRSSHTFPARATMYPCTAPTDVS